MVAFTGKFINKLLMIKDIINCKLGRHNWCNFVGKSAEDACRKIPSRTRVTYCLKCYKTKNK